MKHIDKTDLGELIIAVMNGSADDQQQELLGKILAADPQAMKYYLELMVVHTGLDWHLSKDNLKASEADVIGRGGDDVSEDITCSLEKLAEEEKTAPRIVMEEPEEDMVGRSYTPRGPRPVGYRRRILFNVACFMMPFMALLWFDVWLTRHQNAPSPPVVARLIDQIGAVWDHSMQTPDQNGHLIQKTYRLTHGYVSIDFNSGTNMTIEAPATWVLLNDNEMELVRGRIYTIVPERARGFSVVAGDNKIVDLGTEFGVEVDTNKETQLHVTKGRTVLFTGFQSGNKSEVNVDAGAAKKVYNDGFVRDIPYNKTRFVHQIDSINNFIWKGKKSIDLADIVSGGNGFGTGRKGFCIMPDTGRFTATEETPLGSDPSGVTKLHLSYMRAVPDLPAVDCVIVPGYEASGNLPLSTTGLSIPDFPELTGSMRWRIQTQPYRKEGIVTLNGTRYGVDENPAILIHANCGITFDLDKIRQNISGLSIVSFKALCGINESIIKNNYDPERTADFHVFLDGKPVFYQSLKHIENNAVPVEIDLTEGTHRFITLLVTCGQQSNDNDHGVFGAPELILQD